MQQCRSYLDLEPSIVSAVANITGADEINACTDTCTMNSSYHWFAALETTHNSPPIITDTPHHNMFLGYIVSL